MAGDVDARTQRRTDERRRRRLPLLDFGHRVHYSLSQAPKTCMLQALRRFLASAYKKLKDNISPARGRLYQALNLREPLVLTVPDKNHNCAVHMGYFTRPVRSSSGPGAVLTRVVLDRRVAMPCLDVFVLIQGYTITMFIPILTVGLIRLVFVFVLIF